MKHSLRFMGELFDGTESPGGQLRGRRRGSGESALSALRGDDFAGESGARQGSACPVPSESGYASADLEVARIFFGEPVPASPYRRLKLLPVPLGVDRDSE